MNSQFKKLDADVVVVGGGAAGVFAAKAAAREGSQVILIEKQGFLGGMATAAYVGTICGLYYRRLVDGIRYVEQDGLQAFAEELSHRSQSAPVKGQQGLQFLPYDQLVFKQLCDEMLQQASVQVLFHATVCRVHTERRRIQGIDVMTNQGIVTVQAKSIVDASGHAVIGHLVDEIKLIKSSSYQAGAFVFGLNQLNIHAEMQLNLHLIKALKVGIKLGDLSDDKSWISLVPGSLKNGSAFFKLSIPFQLHEQTFSTSIAEQFARKKVSNYIAYLKRTVEVFRNAKISMTAPAVGVRTGPRYQGKYILTEDDVLSCRKSTESAARGVWPIEYWEPGERVQMKYFNEDDYYDIPKDCLVCEEIENLFFAGRHISASESAIASARVIGTCMQMGECSGFMASSFISDK